MLKDRPGRDRAASFRLYFISIPLGDAKFVTKEGRSAGQAPILIRIYMMMIIIKMKVMIYDNGRLPETVISSLFQFPWEMQNL